MSPIGDFVKASEFEFPDNICTAIADDDVVVQYSKVKQQPLNADPDSAGTIGESEQRNEAKRAMLWKRTATSSTVSGRSYVRELNDARF